MISSRDAVLSVVLPTGPALRLKDIFEGCFSICCPSPAQPITLITASMGVHPFYHQEERHSDDDRDGVFEQIDGRHDCEDEDGLVLLSITSITASMRFHPFHREKRRTRRISRCSCHRRHHCRQHHGRPHPYCHPHRRQHHGRPHPHRHPHRRQHHGHPHPHDGMRPRLSL